MSLFDHAGHSTSFFIMVRPEDEPYRWLNPRAFILRYGRLSEAS